MTQMAIKWLKSSTKEKHTVLGVWPTQIKGCMYDQKTF
jgi:hypothetical protein